MTPTELAKELDDLEVKLERLRVKYDQYFMGIEKILPSVQRKDVDRRFQALQREQMRNTGLRFKFQTLVQRFTSYQTYWHRILRQIEEGTFRRDVMRAQRLGLGLANPHKADPHDFDNKNFADDPSQSDEGLPSEAPPPDPGAPVLEAMPRPPAAPAFADDGGGSGMREEIPMLPGAPGLGLPHTPPPPATPGFQVPPPAGIPRPRTGLSPFGAMRAPTPPKGTPAGVPQPPRPGVAPPPVPPTAAAPRPATPPPPPAPPADPGMQSLYNRYIEARKQTGENTNVRFETVAKQVAETLPRLREKYQGAEVSLDVTIKDGKAILRPVVKVRKKTP